VSIPRNDALLAWYRDHQRDLPWRRTRDPYRILVSEVMLQQTQVTRVLDRYWRFLGRFPDEHALAAAGLADVLGEWAGLGYNRRAANLRSAAIHVSTNGWPTTISGLMALPGVGPYTAAALASFAFGADVAAVDINLRRVISRWEGEPLSGARLRDRASDLLAAGHAADWNQAIMDLGSALCRPVAPDCSSCPVERWCADPDVTSSSPRQARFAGSNREARGAIIRMLAGQGTLSLDEIALTSGIAVDRLQPAALQLAEEGLIAESGDRLLLGSETALPS
jgi:A/G-specific adenine glycosylase